MTRGRFSVGDRVRVIFLSGAPLGTVFEIARFDRLDRTVFVRLDAHRTDSPIEIACQYDESLELYRTGLDVMLELL